MATKQTKIALLKKIIKNNHAQFLFYRQGYVYYGIIVDGEKFMFPIELTDVGTGTLNDRMKAIVLMRWIRKALDGKMFVRAPKETNDAANFNQKA